MIDIWFIFTMLIPFSMVILLSIDDYLHFKIDSVNFTKITPVLPTKENLKTPIYESFLNNKKEIQLWTERIDSP